MNHIKDNWTTGEVFKASDLNEIARTLNALVDKHESIINDAAPSDESAYSSNKIIEVADAAKANVINDEQASGDSTFSSSKILEAINGNKLKTVVVDELPETGEENTLYIVPSSNIPEPEIACSVIMVKDENDVITMDMESFEDPVEGLSVGDVFEYKKSSQDDPKLYVLSDIDKDELICSVDIVSRDELIMRLTNGVNGTIELKDGHYYKLIDRYQLKTKNVDGTYSTVLIDGIGAEAFVYEEVFNPSIVKYNNAPYVPGANGLANCIYDKLPSFDFVTSQNPEQQTQRILYPSVLGSIEVGGDSFNRPKELKVGDIIKTAKEYEAPIVYIESTDDENLSAQSIKGGSVSGIVRTNTWVRDGYYRFTGYHDVAVPNSTFPDIGRSGKLKALTFERITNADHYDYEQDGLPSASCIFDIISTNDKWLWVNGEWELLSAAEININDNN